jgi:hypothetical protein
MAKTKGPLMSLEASGKFAGTIVFDKRGYARILKVPANPQTVGQMATRNMLADIQAELKALGAVARAAVKTDLGYHWNALIIGELMKNDNAVYDAYAAEFAGFIEGDQGDWESADPAVSLNGTAGEVFYAVASALYDLSIRADGDGIVTQPATANSSTVAGEWVAAS